MSASNGLGEFFRSRQNHGMKVVKELPKLDIDNYISNYSGRTRYERLLQIALSCPPLCIDALKAAVKEAKRGKDVPRYRDAQKLLAQLAPDAPEATLDGQWVDRTEKQVRSETKRLEDEVKQYKNNLVKESVRMGNEDLGLHYQIIGELGLAFEAFTRMRADVSTAKHMADVSKRTISVAIEQRNWISVLSNVQKIRTIQLTQDEEKALRPYCCIASGLAHMANEDYYEAARDFLSTPASMGNSLNDTMSPHDVAVYGGLCALASMDRNEIQRLVLENSSFRHYLELEPQLRRAIGFFVNSRYSACLDILETYRVDYELDIHLHKHVSEFYFRIRSKSIIQYFIPFSSVTLDSLNDAFGKPNKPVLPELIRMIQRGTLNARIDRQKGLLVSVPTLNRASLHKQALDSAHAYEQEVRRRIQRINLVAADLEVKGGKAKAGYQTGSMGIPDFLNDTRSPERD